MLPVILGIRSALKSPKWCHMFETLENSFSGYLLHIWSNTRMMLWDWFHWKLWCGELPDGWKTKVLVKERVLTVPPIQVDEPMVLSTSASWLTWRWVSLDRFAIPQIRMWLERLRFPGWCSVSVPSLRLQSIGRLSQEHAPTSLVECAVWLPSAAIR